MKAKIFTLIVAILCLSVLFVACDKECVTHGDANNDGVCDNCAATVEIVTEIECDDHADEDEDQKCDVCDKDLIVIVETEIVTVLVTESETEPVICEAHVDEDADKICEVCGRAIVVIVENVSNAPETEVPMVVNPVPDDAAASDYINTKLPANEFFSASQKLEGLQNIIGNFAYCTYEAKDGQVYHKVIDLASNKEVASYQNVYTGIGYETVYEISLSEYWFTLRTIRNEVRAETETYWEDQYNPETGYWESVEKTRVVEVREIVESTWAAYSYANKMIGKAYTIDYRNDYGYEPFQAPTFLYEYGTQEYYVLSGETVYVIDPASHDIIYEQNKDIIVARPQFTQVAGNYGYVFNETSVYVYDLTSWINCVYSYTAPSTYLDMEMSMLQNGNVLVWANVVLPDKAVSYDFLEYGKKYDMVYVILDPKNNTEKTVEFGYSIESVFGIGNVVELLASVGYNTFTAAAEKFNMAVVYPVENDYINLNAPMYLIVDDELNIMYQTNIASTVLVANDKYLTYIEFNDGRFVYELVDINGKHIDYLSTTVVPGLGYKITEDYTVMTYNNEVIFDLSEYAGTIEIDDTSLGGYIIAYEEEISSDYVYDSEGKPITNPDGTYETETTVTYHYYNYTLGDGKGEESKIKTSAGVKEFNFVEVNEYGYQISYTSYKKEVHMVDNGMGVMEETLVDVAYTVYEFYNAENTLVFTSAGSYAGEIYEDDSCIVVRTFNADDTGFEYYRVSKK